MSTLPHAARVAEIFKKIIFLLVPIALMARYAASNE